jgi:hypothetical protein
MREKIIKTKAHVARIAKVTRGAVTRACKGRLGAAVIAGKIDINHQVAIDYITKCQDRASFKDAREVKNKKDKQHKKNQAKKVAQQAKMIFDIKAEKNKTDKQAVNNVVSQYALDKKAQEVSDEAAQLKQDEKKDIEAYLGMTLHDIISTFGSDVEFVEWLKSAKLIEDVKEKRIRNQTSLGNFIPREYVKNHIFAMLETTYVRLLTDSPRTIAARVLDAHTAGQTREDIETLIGDLISVQLKGIKLRARRALKE